MIIKGLPGLALVFLIWPMLLGMALGMKKNLDRYLIGFAAVQALFYLVYIPAITLSWSSQTLAYTAAVMITLAGAAGTAIRYFKAGNKKEFLALNRPNFRIFKNPFFLIAMLIVIYEIVIQAVKEPYIYGDDAIYMRIVTSIVDTNAIYTKGYAGQINPTPLGEINFKHIFTSYYPFLASISIVCKLHPLVLCKTVIPMIYVPVSYLTIWRIGQFLFGKEDDTARIRKQSMFMFFYAILIEFGQISYYTLSRRVTIWIYNNKSDLFVILLPILFFYTYFLLNERTDLKLIYRQAIIAIMALACNSASTMGIVLSAMTIGLWYLISAVRQKKPSILFVGLWTLIPHVIAGLLLIRFTGFSI